MNEFASQADPEARLKAAAELSLGVLSDAELAALYNNATWGDGNTRSRVEKASWFPKVEHLFTEKGGYKKANRQTVKVFSNPKGQ